MRIALLPLQRLPGLADLLVAWDEGRDALALRVDASGQVRLAVGNRDRAWRVPASPPPWPLRDLPVWELRIGRPPAVLIAGSGPEAPLLLPLLDQLGWRCVVVEPRDRWRAAHLADVGHRGAAFERLQDALDAAPPLDAALVMHHNFEMDRDALETLSRTPLPFIGLLGPARRRDDLLRLLPPRDRTRLQPRLRAPVGLPLGGQGPEAIAMSIGAQLQAYRHADA
ncbi:XdhC family protein [Lysobacter sp. SG-8]|uniref:XdhC family protein n=1 Tax=Marilutibacter penaei TaxID=2759900 RepID=A0A7W3U527_9GAMM|nr:XdhC family protein [Lysobacter penaei]MBB1089119.1 XdhC family protein [Lysobacter penaei]